MPFITGLKPKLPTKQESMDMEAKVQAAMQLEKQKRKSKIWQSYYQDRERKK